MNCGMDRGVKLLDHAMKFFENVLAKILIKVATMHDMQFGSMPGKGTINAVFIFRRIQEEYLSKQRKQDMSLVDLKKSFDRVPRKVVEWAMMKKGIPEALVRALMSMYKGARTKAKVGRHLSEEHEVNVGVHHGSVLSPLLFAIVIDVVTNEMKEGMSQEILYADDIALIAETMAELHKKIMDRKVHLGEKA